jgi:hypothetical protein
LRRTGGNASLAFIHRNALDTSSVVAELRPSADRLATLLISRARNGRLIAAGRAEAKLAW